MANRRSTGPSIKIPGRRLETLPSKMIYTRNRLVKGIHESRHRSAAEYSKRKDYIIFEINHTLPRYSLLIHLAVDLYVIFDI